MAKTEKQKRMVSSILWSLNKDTKATFWDCDTVSGRASLGWTLRVYGGDLSSVPKLHSKLPPTQTMQLHLPCLRSHVRLYHQKLRVDEM